MELYLIDEFFRLDGATGELLEKEFSGEFVRHGDGIRLECCRNEYVSFQLVCDAGNGEAGGGSVAFEPLEGEGGGIPAGCYSAYAEWFHEIGERRIPDALVPLTVPGPAFPAVTPDCPAAGTRIRALWIDLFVPKGTPAGAYLGGFTVSAGITRRFTVALRVRNVTLTDESLIYADMNNYADSLSPAFPALASNPERYDDGSYARVEQAFHRMSYDHRCIFHNLGYDHAGCVIPGYAPEVEGEGRHMRVAGWDRFDRHFGPLLDGTAFEGLHRPARPIPYMYLPFNFDWPSGYDKWGKKGYRTEYRRVLADFLSHFERRGWTDTRLELFLNHKKRYRMFPYDGDETRFEGDEALFDVYYELNGCLPDSSPVQFVFRMDSSWSYGRHFNSRFADIVRMWVVNGTIFLWYPESVALMKRRGNTLWNYGGLNDMADSHLSLTVWPFRCVMTGITGVTFWNATGFGEDWLRAPLENGRQAAFYPGAPFGFDGPVPSIRLKALRNAMQTADLMMTLDGTEWMPRLREIVNRQFGASDGDWWSKRPAFADEPPHTWTNAKLSEAPRANVKSGLSPAVAGRVKQEVLDCMERLGIHV